MKNFSETQPPKQEMETDRVEIKAGMEFVITDILIVESKKYEHIAKVNGYTLTLDNFKTPIKLRTTSKTLIDQLEKMIKTVGGDAGRLDEVVKVGVKSEQSQKTKYSYLTFYDVK